MMEKREIMKRETQKQNIMKVITAPSLPENPENQEGLLQWENHETTS